MSAEHVYARMAHSTNETIVYYFVTNSDPENLNDDECGILEMDRSVFEQMKPDDIERLSDYTINQMKKDHIRILKNAKDQSINQFGIDTVPFDILREIFKKYLAHSQIPDFACYFYYDFVKEMIQYEEVRKILIENGAMSKEDVAKLLAEDEEKH